MEDVLVQNDGFIEWEKTTIMFMIAKIHLEYFSFSSLSAQCEKKTYICDIYIVQIITCEPPVT